MGSPYLTLLLGPKTCVREVTCHQGESITIILLSRYNIKLIHDDIVKPID